MKVVIIGGVAGGATAAARLRRLYEDIEILIIEKSEYISYANCGLPYYIGEVIKNKESLIVQKKEDFEKRFNINVKTKNEVLKIDTNKKIVIVKDIEKNSQYEENYDKLIIATGAKSKIPNIKGIDNKNIFILKNVEDTLKIKEYIDEIKPKKAIIIGGGYIGIETAENLFNLGIDVDIIQHGKHIINNIDYDMACIVQEYIKKKGIKLIIDNEVKEIQKIDNQLKLILSNTNEEIITDMIIISAGIEPNSDIVKDTKIKLDKKGCIIVNNKMKTSVKDVFAVGDVTKTNNYIKETDLWIPLAGPANKQGRIAANNIGEVPSKYTYTQGSSIIKIFDMTVASTGITEEIAQKSNIKYNKIYLLSPDHAGYYPNAHYMDIKVIFEQITGKILGAQIIGKNGVDKRCDILSVAIRAKMKAKELVHLELCYAPPYNSAKDPVNMVGYIIENMINDKVRMFFPEEIEQISKNEGNILIDVRTPQEYNLGHIEDAINIPLDQIREKIYDIEKEKTLYINCQTGMRSYIACRILTHHGFKCYNLSGGYRLYNIIKNSSKRS